MLLTMQRRRFMNTLLAAPAASSLLAQQPAPGVQANPAPGIPVNPAQPIQPPVRLMAELPKIDASVADAVSEPVPHFFAPAQFAALQKLSDLLMPAMKNAPGALDAKAAEFLDFLIGDSPADRQQIYRAGLDAVNAQAAKQFKRSFADLDAAQAASLLSPLGAAWTYAEPSDPLAKFLRVARQDVRTATVNSREYNAKGPAPGGRRFGVNGLYWYPLD